MIKDFLNSSGAYIKFLILALCIINKCWSQILPSSFGVHHKPSEASVNYALFFDADGEYISTEGSQISGAWTIEVWYKRPVNTNTASFLRANAGNNIAGNWEIILSNKYVYSGTNYYGVSIGNNSGLGGTWYPNTPVVDTWEHVVVRQTSGGYFDHYLNYQIDGGVNWNTVLNWAYISNLTNGLRGEIDEVRIWNDLRSNDEIIDNMHIELQGNESNLVAYYKMSDGNGTSLSDNSSNNYSGTITGASWATSYAPIGNLENSYKYKPYALWKKTGTSNSRGSNGLSLNVSVSLTESNYVIYGNNDNTGISTTNLPSGESLQKRSSRIWQFDEIGTVTSDIKIDISSATGNSVTPSSASNYKLLYKSCDSCNFSVYATGSSNSGDVVTFSNITIQDGFYAIATTDSNL